MPETNRLLDGLPHRVRQRLLAVCDPLEITAGTVLLDQGEISRHAYFPLGGIIGLASGVDRHQPLETGLVGNEGMLGATLTLGIDVTPCRATVHGGGRILRVAFVERLRGEKRFDSVDDLIEAMKQDVEKTRAVCASFHRP